METRHLNLTKCYELDDETMMNLTKMYDNEPIRNLTGQLRRLDEFLLQKRRNIADLLNNCETELDGRTEILKILNASKDSHFEQAVQQKEVKFTWEE